MIEPWVETQTIEVEALLADVLPDEHLSADELSILWEDDGAVFASGDDGVVAGVVRRPGGGEVVGHVRLLAVADCARRNGIGARLLETAERWLGDQGCTRVVLGGEAPFYLWPGVDVASTGALCLAEREGYRPVGAALNMACSTGYRQPPPPGVEIIRALENPQVDRVLAFAADNYQWWADELARAIEQGGAFGAFDGDSVVGFACHSVNRVGWIGPMATEPSRRGGGVGSALLASVWPGPDGGGPHDGRDRLGRSGLVLCPHG